MLRIGTQVIVPDERDGIYLDAVAEIVLQASRASGKLPGYIVRVLDTGEQFWVAASAVVAA